MTLKIKLILFFTIAVVSSRDSLAQIGLYMKSNGEIAYDKESSDYIRVIGKLDSGLNLYPITEYYKSGKVKLRGHSASIDPVKYVGLQILYHPNGRVRQKRSYVAGKIVGDVYDFHQNGTAYSRIKISQHLSEYNRMEREGVLPPQIEVVFAKDSLGQDMVVDGNGYYVLYADGDPNIIEAEGKVVAGKWDGEVTGRLTDLKLSYVEKYKKGVLLSGVSTDSLGKSYSYTHHLSVPRYSTGMEEFNRFLQKNLRGLPFTGRIYVEFFIDVNGNLVEPKILRKVESSTEKAILDVLSKSGKWIPARKKGIPYKLMVTLPIVL